MSSIEALERFANLCLLIQLLDSVFIGFLVVNMLFALLSTASMATVDKKSISSGMSKL